MSDDEEEQYQSNGIRHIEIQKKSPRHEIDESNDSDLDDSFDQVLLKNKKKKYKEKEKEREMEREREQKQVEEQVNLNTLMKAVIDISDRLEIHEEKVSQYERKIEDDEKVMISKIKTKSRPKTAVMKYALDEYEDSDDRDNDSDRETLRSTSTLSTTSSRTRRRTRSAKDTQSFDTSSRHSMSFSNDTVRRIDSENQRLLKGILKAKSRNTPTKATRPVRVKSAATINRERKQLEIDRENMRLLGRLQAVKPTNGLRRDKLMMDHVKNEKTTERLMRSNRRPVSAPVSRSAARTASRESNFDIQSVSSLRTGSVASMRSSTSSRASSARSRKPKKVVVQEYWEPGW